MAQVFAPFTVEQVQSLNGFQHSGMFHPFTCGGESCRDVLVATEAGWKCPSCDYTQIWAHDFMADFSWSTAIRKNDLLRGRILKRLAERPELLDEIRRRLQEEDDVE